MPLLAGDVQQIAVQGSMFFTGQAKSAVAQIYSHYTENGSQGRHLKGVGTKAGNFQPAQQEYLSSSWCDRKIAKFLQDVKKREHKQLQ